MKKRRWFDGWLPMGLVLLSLHGAAQDSFHYRVPVDTPANSDFYRIVLSPEIVAHSQTDLSDLRILGADGRFISYVLKDTADSNGHAYLPVPDPLLMQKDSNDKHSYLLLRWPESYRIDRISLTVRSPALYKRWGKIFCQWPDLEWVPEAWITIDPLDTSFNLQAVKTRSLRIDIDNEDNVPLKIVKISAVQARIYLLAYLQAGASYTLLAGNRKIRRPRYDLGYFTDSMTKRPREIGLGQGRETVVIAGGPEGPIAKTTDKPGGKSGLLLWSILSTVLLLLIYFSVKMVEAISAKKSPHDRV